MTRQIARAALMALVLSTFGISTVIISAMPAAAGTALVKPKGKKQDAQIKAQQKARRKALEKKQGEIKQNLKAEKKQVEAEGKTLKAEEDAASKAFQDAIGRTIKAESAADKARAEYDKYTAPDGTPVHVLAVDAGKALTAAENTLTQRRAEQAQARDNQLAAVNRRQAHKAWKDRLSESIAEPRLQELAGDNNQVRAMTLRGQRGEYLRDAGIQGRQADPNPNWPLAAPPPQVTAYGETSLGQD